MDGESLRLAGNDAFLAQDWSKAVDKYTQSLQKSPGDKRVYSNRSAALVKMAEMLDRDPGATVASDGRTYAQLLQAALDDAERVIHDDPQWAKGYYRKGIVLERMGRDDEAVSTLVHGLQMNPEDGEQLRSSSPALRAAFERSDKSAPKTRDAATSSALATEETDSPTTRTADTAKVTREGLAAAEKLRLEGNKAYGIGDWDQAIRSYTEAINVLQQEDAPDRRIFSNRSAAYLHKAEETGSSLSYQYALEDGENCVRLDSTWAKGYFRLSMALAGAGRREEAVEKLKLGLRSAEDDRSELEDALRDLEHKVKREAGAASTESASRPKQRTQPTQVADTKLYDTLGVKSNATLAEIKKAYFLLARETHPDKNKQDPEATEKFQRLGQAYQVLSNDETRETYDKHGMKGLERMNYEDVDPSKLFAMMFGSDRFEVYLGELQLTTLTARLDDEGNPPSEETLKRIQKERVAELTKNLIRLVQPFVDGNQSAFVSWVRKEAAELREANLGGSMMLIMGQCYNRHANVALGKQQLFGLASYWRRFNLGRARFNAKWNTTTSTLRVVAQQKQLEEQAKKAEKEGITLTDEEQAQIAANIAMGYLDLIWKRTVMDIVLTLDEVCHNVLEGKDVTHLPENREGAQSTSLAAQQHGRHKSGGGGFDWKAPLASGARLLSTSASKVETVTGGQRAESRSEVIAARAAALKTMGKIFIESGSAKVDDEMAGIFASAQAAMNAESDEPL